MRLLPHVAKIALVLGAALALLGAAVTTASAVDGWRQSPESGSVTFSTPFFDERIQSASCRVLGGDGSVTGEFAGEPDDPGTFRSGVTLRWQVDQSFSPQGTNVSCQAVYYERDRCGLFCFEWRFSHVTRRFVGIIRVDQTAPLDVRAFASGPQVNGWFNTPSQVRWFGQDRESGIFFCDTRALGSFDTVGDTITAGCVNKAGLRTNAPFTYRFDGTNPTLSPSITPAPVLLGGTASATPNASDNLSGVQSASCDPVDAATVGPHVLTCTATDVAGNTAVEDVDYTVGYAFSGFAAPVDAQELNAANAGQTVPLRFRVADAADQPITGLTADSVSVSVRDLSCDTGVTEDLPAEAASGASGLRHTGDGNYVFSWKTPKAYASSCKSLRLDLGDGLVHTASFSFR